MTEPKITMTEALQATTHKVKSVGVVESEEDAAGYEAVVCATIEAIPIPSAPATEENCSRCDARIWVGVDAPKTPPRICYQCYVVEVEHLKEDLHLGVSKKTAERLGFIDNDERSN